MDTNIPHPPCCIALEHSKACETIPKALAANEGYRYEQENGQRTGGE